MEHTFEYAILMAEPDPRRGERVNVGLVVFLPDRIDVRFSDLAKVRALAAGDWAEYIKDANRRLMSLFLPDQQPHALMRRFSLLEPIIRFSDLGWFSIERPEQYEERVKSILATLVNRPKPGARPKSTRINTEIAREFRRTKVLARPDEGIGDHRVVRDFYVSEEEELKADFLVRNGIYHVTATLDLRRASNDISQATLKAVVLDKARQVFGAGSRRFGVYAAPPAVTETRPHIAILRDYADETFNWLDPDQRQAYTRAIYGAIHGANVYQLT